MGGEFGQQNEWYHERELDWHLLQYSTHQGVHQCVKDLNRLYRSEPALYQKDFTGDGFEWVDLHDSENSVISFLRRGENPEDIVLVVCNFTPMPRHKYRLGVPVGGFWEEIFNSDGAEYGGSGWGNFGGVEAQARESHWREYSLLLSIPPLGVVYLRPTK
jgi:1,4-alpha-glucan branching enzyme